MVTLQLKSPEYWATILMNVSLVFMIEEPDVELEDIALENKDSAKQDKRINRIAINIKVAANKFFGLSLN